MKKILVTGGAGFIGSNLCEYLLRDNNEVICLDNFYTGRRKNVEKLTKNNKFKIIEWDIRNPIDLEVDEIYNAACPASPPAYQKSPTYTMKTNVLGTINMLELAKKYDAKLVQFSTSEVYGQPLEHPQSEEYFGNVNPNGIRACYDEGKRASEALCYDYNREFGCKSRIIRIFNTYGPNMDPNDGRVVSNFIIQALKNEPITIYGDGTQTRSFCFVDDLVRGIVKMMDSEKVISTPINLGNPQEFTVKELAEMILKKIDSKSTIHYMNLPQDDPLKRRPNINKAKKELEWEPTITLNEGLDKTIEYFMQEIGNC